MCIGTATVTLQCLQTEPPTNMSLGPAQSALRYMLFPWFLRDRMHDTGAGIARGGMGAILDLKEATIKRKVAMKVMLDT
jgi:hypothetical protein